MNFKEFNLKTVFIFKEAHIPTTREVEDMRKKLRENVLPAIMELESKKLINSFHYLTHTDIDLRLSCIDWKLNEKKIQLILVKHQIPRILNDWGEPVFEDEYNESLMQYIMLELSSRFSLALIGFADKKDFSKRQNEIWLRQWIHFIFNELGYLNADQIRIELFDSYGWLNDLISRNPKDLDILFFAGKMIRDAKKMTKIFYKKSYWPKIIKLRRADKWKLLKKLLCPMVDRFVRGKMI